MHNRSEQDNSHQPTGDAWCVIPVYNNAATVREIALAAYAHVPNVLVVDDGSTDADLEALLEGTEIVVLKHDTNLGKGRAILTGLDYLAQKGAVFMITLDGDGQHSPDDIPRLLSVMRENPDSIVIGRRDFSGADVPGSSKFGRAFSNFWVRLETGHEAGDSQSGFRAYPVSHLRNIKFTRKHYDFEVEVLVRALWAGLSVQVVDVSVSYTPDQKARSSFKPFLDNLRFSLMHTALVGRRLVFWPHKRLVPKQDSVLQLLHPRKFMESLLKEHATPAALAASAAVGIFLGVLPLISVHMIVILYVTARLNLNKLMALTIQNLCMPPLVPVLCIELGYFMRHGSWLTELSKETIWYQAPSRLLEWLLGSLIVAPIGAALAGGLVYLFASLIQKKRGNAHAGH